MELVYQAEYVMQIILVNEVPSLYYTVDFNTPDDGGNSGIGGAVGI